ncbi:MAG: class I SAM-dependent methyltransferase [Deltaproteobacteria bacterium]|nr:class I SAM-dependent methyltransferase [Kofleriaceae bacterium]
MATSSSSVRISPTAHYTGYTWLQHGLSHPAFATPTGRFLYRALVPANKAMAAAGQGTLDGFLLARHHLIDALLRRAIESGQVSQVIEVACGLSPRGYRFAQAHGDAITYVEADLPPMAAKKRELLARAGAGAPTHRVVEIDATAETGEHSIDAIAAGLDPARGTAIITEGLLNYFDPASVAGMWGRFARALGRFPHGLYLADLHLGEHARPIERVFAGLLGVFVRGRIHFHYPDAPAATVGLSGAGFGRPALRAPEEHQDLIGPVHVPSARAVRIVEAWLR